LSTKYIILQMDGWFDDPFFDRNAHHAGDIQSHFASMERRMNDMMGSMFSGFGFDDSRRGRLEDSRPTASLARVEEVTDGSDAPRVTASRTHPIVEEPDDPAPERPQRKPAKPAQKRSSIRRPRRRSPARTA
jgi:hypothetical protein